MAVPAIEGKYVPASPTAVGKMGAMNQPAARAQAATSERFWTVNMPARQSTDPAALISNTRVGPRIGSVYWLAHRPAIMDRAKAEINPDAAF